MRYIACFSRIALSIMLVGLQVLPIPVIAEAQQTTTFSGQATVVRATVLGFKPVLLSDTGPLPSSGGAQQASLLSASVPNLLSVDVLHATTVGQGDRSRSEASVADVSLTVGGNAISADFVMSSAMAVCTSSGPATSGSSELANLVINGQTIAVSGAPNQTISLPAGGQVVINEQKSGGPGDITVNALHVSIPSVADVVISSAHADVTCAGPSNCSINNEFVTGGGWITTAGEKANFGVGGGLKNGSLWGHLEYIDHGTGMKVHGTGVTGYSVTGPTSRRIEGTAEINGQPGFTYKIDVADNGTPGRGVDTFSIQLSNGYSASNKLGGGNIQLHKPCQ